MRYGGGCGGGAAQEVDKCFTRIHSRKKTFNSLQFLHLLWVPLKKEREKHKKERGPITHVSVTAATLIMNIVRDDTELLHVIVTEIHGHHYCSSNLSISVC